MEDKAVEFHGGWAMSLVPMALFIIACTLCFAVFHIFDMNLLSMRAFLAIIIGGCAAKNYAAYWGAVISEGIGSRMAVTIFTILLVISMFAKLMAKSGVAEGFVWIADAVHLHGGMFAAFAFLATCVISASAGSSIGALFTGFPVFSPSGIMLGADPVVLASAILSGAIFGDNVAPISDTTVASASTQSYSMREGTAEISGVVAARFKYAFASAVISALLFYLFGGASHGLTPALANAHTHSPKGLIRLLPVAGVLIVAVKTQDIFKAIPVGLILGIVIGLASGIFTLGGIFSLKDGSVEGFLYQGFNGMIGTVTFVLSLFGIIGVLRASRTMERCAKFISNSKLARSTRGAEIAIAFGIGIATILLGGVMSASILAFGPVANEIGKEKKLHPHRRAVLVHCVSMTLPAVVPFLSAFIFIVISIIGGLRSEYPLIPQINPVLISITSFYPISLFFVMAFSIYTGWGRTFEGEKGEPVKEI
jgi:Na+/H+ antiporter NhaC